MNNKEGNVCKVVLFLSCNRKHISRAKLNTERMMLVFWQLFVLITERASSTLLELTSPAGKNPVNTSRFGVDISRCNSITLQAKTCHGAHLWLGDGTGAGSYETAVAIHGGDYTELRPHSMGHNAVIIMKYTKDIMACASYRTVWISWANNRLSFGEGKLPNENVVFDVPNPKFHAIHYFAFMGYFETGVTVRLGDANNAQFKIMSDNAVFSDTPMEEMTVSSIKCAVFCNNNNNCGMFSYNKAQGTCALFNRMTSSFVLKTQAGWKSWKMQYC